MSLKENLARFIQAFMEKNKLSMTKLQTMAGISPNSLYAYSRGTGNPTLSTVDCLATNLNVNPTAMMMGVYYPDSQEFSVLFLSTVEGISKLTREERYKFMWLLNQEVVDLWNGE